MMYKGQRTYIYNNPTGWELDILRLAAKGYRNREIGEQQGVHEQTIKYHLSNLYRKLCAKDRANAVAIAIRTGLIS